MKQALIIALIGFGNLPAIANTNDIVCTLSVGSSITVTTNLANTYLDTIDKTDGFIVKNLTSSSTSNSIKIGIFGPNKFRLNVDLPIANESQHAQVSLGGISNLGEISISCRKP